MSPFQAVFRILYICQDLLREALRFLLLLVNAKAALAAEVLFLRKQLVFYQERKIKPRRFNDSARLSMLLLAELFDWKNALVNVKPETFIGWHEQAFQLFWRWKSRGGRPRLPKDRFSSHTSEAACRHSTSQTRRPFVWAIVFDRKTGSGFVADRPRW